MDQELHYSHLQSERGSAGVKLLIFLVVLVLLGNAGVNYVPVAYEAEEIKHDMQQAVVQGMAVMPGQKPVDLVRQKINRLIETSDAPSNTYVQVREVNQIVYATIKYTKRVNILPFGIYQYDYVFDHTATPSGFLLQ